MDIDYGLVSDLWLSGVVSIIVVLLAFLTDVRYWITCFVHVFNVLLIQAAFILCWIKEGLARLFKKNGHDPCEQILSDQREMKEKMEQFEKSIKNVFDDNRSLVNEVAFLKKDRDRWFRQGQELKYKFDEMSAWKDEVKKSLDDVPVLKKDVKNLKTQLMECRKDVEKVHKQLSDIKNMINKKWAKRHKNQGCNVNRIERNMHQLKDNIHQQFVSFKNEMMDKVEQTLQNPPSDNDCLKVGLKESETRMKTYIDETLAKFVEREKLNVGIIKDLLKYLKRSVENIMRQFEEEEIEFSDELHRNEDNNENVMPQICAAKETVESFLSEGVDEIHITSEENLVKYSDFGEEGFHEKDLECREVIDETNVEDLRKRKHSEIIKEEINQDFEGIKELMDKMRIKVKKDLGKIIRKGINQHIEGIMDKKVSEFKEVTDEMRIKFKEDLGEHFDTIKEGITQHVEGTMDKEGSEFKELVDKMRIKVKEDLGEHFDTIKEGITQHSDTTKAGITLHFEDIMDKKVSEFKELKGNKNERDLAMIQNEIQNAVDKTVEEKMEPMQKFIDNYIPRFCMQQRDLENATRAVEEMKQHFGQELNEIKLRKEDRQASVFNAFLTTNGLTFDLKKVDVCVCDTSDCDCFNQSEAVYIPNATSTYHLSVNVCPKGFGRLEVYLMGEDGSSKFMGGTVISGIPLGFAQNIKLKRGYKYWVEVKQTRGDAQLEWCFFAGYPIF